MGSNVTHTKSDATNEKEGKLLGGGREVCWKARDEYFACLQTNHPDVRPLPQNSSLKVDEGKLKEDTPMCTETQNAFHQKCLPSWRHHFLAQKFYVGSIK